MNSALSWTPTWTNDYLQINDLLSRYILYICAQTMHQVNFNKFANYILNENGIRVLDNYSISLPLSFLRWGLPFLIFYFYFSDEGSLQLLFTLS